MLGFTYSEVENLINEIYNDYKLSTNKNKILNTLKQYYDGYKFGIKGEYLYNPTMTLYFLGSLINNDEYPDLMIDTNIRIDYHQIAYIFGNNTKRRDEIIQKITKDKTINFSSKLNVSFNMQNYKNGDYITEGLFYSGILTYGEYSSELKIPNLVTYEMAIDYFKKIKDFNLTGSDISDIVQDYQIEGDAESLIENFFRDTIQKFPGDFFKNANESFYHGLLFHILWNTFPKNVYEVLPEFNLPQGTADIILHSLPQARVRYELQDIFELKQVPKKATEAEFNQKFNEAKTQLQKYLTADYKKWRGIAVCFRGNKDYKIQLF